LRVENGVPKFGNKGFPRAENTILLSAMAQQTDDYDSHDDPGWFRDQLRQRDRLIAELRQEQDEATDLLRRFGEYEDDYNATLESWQEAFGMVLNNSNQWTWEPFWKENWELVDKYNELVKLWNRNVAAFAGLQDVGRPLGASDAQVAAVTKLHKQGKSLRAIVDETSLSFRTVRTIVERKQGTDRTTRARRQKIERIEIDKFQRAHWRRQKRDGDALPKRVAGVIETGKALVTEAKGLGRGR
jgi:hypothetical protein